MEQPQPLTDDELEGARVVVNRSISLVTLANIAEIHADAITMGGCAEVNECDLAALTVEVLQSRAARLTYDQLVAIRCARGFFASVHDLASDADKPEHDRVVRHLDEVLESHGWES